MGPKINKFSKSKKKTQQRSRITKRNNQKNCKKKHFTEKKMQKSQSTAFAPCPSPPNTWVHLGSQPSSSGGARPLLRPHGEGRLPLAGAGLVTRRKVLRLCRRRLLRSPERPEGHALRNGPPPLRGKWCSLNLGFYGSRTTSGKPMWLGPHDCMRWGEGAAVALAMSVKYVMKVAGRSFTSFMEAWRWPRTSLRTHCSSRYRGPPSSSRCAGVVLAPDREEGDKPPQGLPLFWVSYLEGWRSLSCGGKSQKSWAWGFVIPDFNSLKPQQYSFYIRQYRVNREIWS